MEMRPVSAGLEGVIAAETITSEVDGEKGELIIAGFPVEKLAGLATFEEVTYLLWNDRLPNAAQLTAFQDSLARYREIPRIIYDVLKEAATQNVPPMDALRMGASMLSLDSPAEDLDPRGQAISVVARFPTIVAAYWRMMQRFDPIAPRADLSHAANYLYMLFGEEPNEDTVRGLETYLNTVVDHGINASTFAARVIIATQSDFVSAITGAIGALKGPLHGGAPGPALDMVFEIAHPANAETYLRGKLERGERLMGFGHRIYKVRDPRAEVLCEAAKKMFDKTGDRSLYELATEVEKTALRLLAEYKPGRRLSTNVEFYTALLLHGLGFPGGLFTPTFAIGRVSGWLAHCFEQQLVGRIIRPQSLYIGERNREWVLLDDR
jgi:citrate synthase